MVVIRLALTGLLLVAAVFGLNYVWTTYFQDPWTRDARVFAHTVPVASYVQGTIVELPVANNAEVRKGDVLLRIDPATYQASLRQAQANLQVSIAERDVKADAALRQTELRNRQPAAVAESTVVQAQLELASANASVEASTAEVESARLDLERTVIRSPVDGFVTNLTANIGDYAQVGSAIIAVVDSASYRIDAYFMETSLSSIEVGAPARVRLMGSRTVLTGHVRGVARAIGDSENTMQSNLLLTPEASFEWIRLAQRVPVDIRLDAMPEDHRLVAGTTASVIVQPRENSEAMPWIRRLQHDLRNLWSS